MVLNNGAARRKPFGERRPPWAPVNAMALSWSKLLTGISDGCIIHHHNASYVCVTTKSLQADTSDRRELAHCHAMAYIAPIHRPSSIRHALSINLVDPNQESLVVA